MNNITGVIEAKLKGLMTKISKNVFSQKSFIVLNVSLWILIMDTYYGYLSKR